MAQTNVSEAALTARHARPSQLIPPFSQCRRQFECRRYHPPTQLGDTYDHILNHGASFDELGSENPFAPVQQYEQEEVDAEVPPAPAAAER